MQRAGQEFKAAGSAPLLQAVEDAEVAVGAQCGTWAGKQRLSLITECLLGTGPRQPPGAKALTIPIPGRGSRMEQGLPRLRVKSWCPGSLLCLQQETDGAGRPTDTRGQETTAGHPGGRSTGEDALPQPGRLSEDRQQGEKEAGSLTTFPEEGEPGGMWAIPYKLMGEGVSRRRNEAQSTPWPHL